MIITNPLQLNADRNEAGGRERWPFARSSTCYECLTHRLEDNDIGRRV